MIFVDFLLGGAGGFIYGRIWIESTGESSELRQISEVNFQKAS